MAAIADMFYKEALEHCQNFNSRIMAERKSRLPYLDFQTNVAQNGCSLWFEKRHRGPGLGPNQVYTYPSKRWKKRPRFNPISESTFDSIYVSEVAHLMNDNSNDSSHVSSFNAGIIEGENSIQDSNSFGGVDLADDDDDYYDDDFEMPSRKKSKRTPKGTKGSRRDQYDDKDKLYACEYCGKKYKNKPGLNYHLQHVHQDEIDADDEYTPSGRHSPSSIISDDHHSSSSRTSALAAQKAVAAAVAEITDIEVGMETRPKTRKQEPQTNKYCDFCLGDADENKKTGEPEELVSCADCGRSGHPSCLQFTDIMTMNVKKYNWQCIECKSCHLCGTSDNDDQLLFCDDCDRGYHMYCLQPPMEQPPEGSWICDLCENDRKLRQKAAQLEESVNSETINL